MLYLWIWIALGVVVLWRLNNTDSWHTAGQVAGCLTVILWWPVVVLWHWFLRRQAKRFVKARLAAIREYLAAQDY